jgi:hypothetical protein
MKFVHQVLSDQGLIRTVFLKAYPVDFANSLKDAQDPDKLLDEMLDRLFSFPLSDEQRSYLRKYLVPEGSPDYEWEGAWYEYKNDPDNLVKRYLVENKLGKLLTAACDLSEFQLM